MARFLGGADLVEPGIVPVEDWRPDGTGLSRPIVPHVVCRGPQALISREEGPAAQTGQAGEA
jgi:hypothetical protein